MIEGSYWGAKASVAGILQDIHVRGPADIEVSLKLQGTDEENLLRWSTGNPTEMLRVHLCGGACPDRLEADNLLHGVSINKRVKEDLPWMSNLVDAGDPGRRPPETGLLCGEAKDKGGGDRGKEAERGRSKKRERGEKRKRKSRERDRSRGRSREKISLRGGATKKLEDVLGGTGLSPDPRFRKKFANKAQRRVKKKKSSSSSSSSSSGSSRCRPRSSRRSTRSAGSQRERRAF